MKNKNFLKKVFFISEFVPYTNKVSVLTQQQIEVLLLKNGFVQHTLFWRHRFTVVENICGMYFIKHTVSKNMTFLGDAINEIEISINYFSRI